jgi:hypothetical protein
MCLDMLFTLMHYIFYVEQNILNVIKVRSPIFKLVKD